jgi:hypothetical protein
MPEADNAEGNDQEDESDGGQTQSTPKDDEDEQAHQDESTGKEEAKKQPSAEAPPIERECQLEHERERERDVDMERERLRELEQIAQQTATEETNEDIASSTLETGFGSGPLPKVPVDFDLSYASTQHGSPFIFARDKSSPPHKQVAFSLPSDSDTAEDTSKMTPEQLKDHYQEFPKKKKTTDNAEADSPEAFDADTQPYTLGDDDTQVVDIPSNQQQTDGVSPAKKRLTRAQKAKAAREKKTKAAAVEAAAVKAAAVNAAGVKAVPVKAAAPKTAAK